MPLNLVVPAFAAGLLGRHVPEGVTIVVGVGVDGVVNVPGTAAPGTHWE